MQQFRDSKMKQLCISFLMVLCFCAFTNKANAQTWNNIGDGSNATNVHATLSDSVLTIRGTGNMADFDVSSGGVPWLSVRSKIKTAVIESGVTNIGNVAFQNCNNLQWITISEGVTIIGVRAFENCSSLSAIAIPASVATIESQAFKGCTALTSIYNQATMPQSISSNVFQGVSISGKNLAVPTQSITTYQSASVWSSFNVVSPYILIDENLGDTISVIGPDGIDFFYEKNESNPNAFKRFTAYNEITNKIEMYAIFNNDGLPSKIVSDNATILLNDYVGYTCNATIITTNGDIYSTSILSDRLWESLNDINPIKNTNQAFALIDLGLSLALQDKAPDLLTKIARSNDIVKFFGVTNIIPFYENINLGLTIIGVVKTGIYCYTAFALGGTNVVADIRCVWGLVKIGKNIYDASHKDNDENYWTESWNYSLDYGTLYLYGSGALPYYSARNVPWAAKNNDIKQLIIGGGITSISSVSFSGCSNLKTVSIENGTTALQTNYDTFSNTSIETLYLGRDITGTIWGGSSSPFSGNSSLKTVTIGNKVTAINASSFSGCTGLTSVSIPNSVTSIGGNAFSGCNSLLSVTIPNLVTSIESGTFSDCSSFTSFTIPNTINSISNNAFSGNSNLKTFTIEDGTTSLQTDYNTFSNTPIETLYLGRNITGTIWGGSSNPFSGNSSLKTVTLGNKVTSINASSFKDCTGLASVNIPISINSIGNSAFSDCSNLKSITIQGSDNALIFSSSAFYNCPIEILNLGRNISNGGYGYDDTPFKGKTSLKTVTVGNQVTTINSSAFSGCTGLTSVTNHATTPQSINANVFSGVNISKIPLYVPTSSINLYQVANVWKDFAGIAGEITTTSISEKEVVIDWAAVPNAVNYTLAVYTDETQTQLFGTYNISASAAQSASLRSVTENRLSYTVTGLSSNTPYYYKLVATGTNNNTIVELSGDFVTQSSSGIHEISMQDISVYPNPVRNELFIKSEKLIDKVEILDIAGRIMVATKSTTVNIAHLPKGVYFAKIFISNQNITKKIIKE
jgi:hypothetical protein